MLFDDNMARIETDKCSENFSLRIPEVTKDLLDKLSPSQKCDLKNDLLYVIAKHLHANEFNPNKYLSSDGI